MKTYNIMLNMIMGSYKICEWEAETAEQAVKEFKESNPSYKNISAKEAR